MHGHAHGPGQPQAVDIVLSGLGAVGASLLRLIAERRERLADRDSLDLRVVAAVDSTGAIADRDGLDAAALAAHKAAGGRTVDFGTSKIVGSTVADVLATGMQVDVLVEAGPGDLDTGGPGLAAVRAARAAGVATVLANKSPLVLAWAELTSAGPAVRYSACVGGALPTVALLRETLRSARPTLVEAALNGTSTLVLRLIEDGYEMAEAVARAQAQGIAEPDPSWDLDGWDAACKLVLLANAALGAEARLEDVHVRGISAVSRDELLRAQARGTRVVALATAEPRGSRWLLSVGPTELPQTHPLARMDAQEMGVVLHTDVAGRLSVMSLEPDAVPSAAAVLRDVVALFAPT
jgi:homoserine dehydrogenase